MKHPLLALLFLASGCSPTSNLTPGEIRDLGVLVGPEPAVTTVTFQVKNTTNRKVRLLSETHSCSCANTEFRSAELGIGDWVPLKITVNLRESFAKEEVLSTIKTDHPRHPEWVYRVRYACFPHIRIDPPFLELSELSLDQTTLKETQAVANLDIYAPPHVSPPTVKEIRHRETLGVEMGQPVSSLLFDGKVRRLRYPLSLTIKNDNNGLGRFMESLVAVTDQGNTAETRVGWDVRGALIAVPSLINFGMVSHSKDRPRRTLLLKHREGKPFTIRVIETGSPDVRVLESGNAMNKTDRCNVVFEYQASPGRRFQAASGAIRVTTDSTSLTEVLVPWSAFVAGSDVRNSDGNAGDTAGKEIPR